MQVLELGAHVTQKNTVRKNSPQPALLPPLSFLLTIFVFLKRKWL